MSDVDAVAEAICEAEGHHWFSQFPDTQDTYRSMAQAAIDALQLTQEWGCWFAATDDEPLPGNRRDAFWHPVDREPSAELRERIKDWPRRELGSRLVSPWVRVEGVTP